MNRKKISIVMSNMSLYSDWQRGVNNRNRQIMAELQTREEVEQIVAIDFLPWGWRQALKVIFFGWLPNLVQPGVVYRSFFTVARRINEKLVVVSSWRTLFSESAFWRELTAITAKLGIEEYVTWSYNPMFVGQLDMPAEAHIFDAVDNWLLHPSFAAHEKRLENNYAQIEKRAQMIFMVAEEIGRLFAGNENVYWIPNAIDWQHYQQTYNLVDRRIADLPHPIIGYIGLILGRLDMAVVEYLAVNNPDKSIVLAGAYRGRLRNWDKKTINKLTAHTNIHLLGYIPYEKAPMYIKQFDVAIIPHRSEGTYVASTNPMKMYEYLACGKPVVATPAPGIDTFPEIRIANTPADFHREVNAALAEDSDLLREQRQAVVKDHTWEKRVNQMLNLLYDRSLA
ncbi:MAG: glycosyltransferase [Candidatus Komeilibacteria bacterium]|nr:glycosyltransferase [Candidatus Komeilibacteria bacterium]